MAKTNDNTMNMANRHKRFVKRIFGIGGMLAFLISMSDTSRANTIRLRFFSDPSGIALAGSGTATVTMALGNAQAFGGTLPAGVTKTINYVGQTWTLSTPFDVRCTTRGIPISLSYTMNARITTSDAVNTWQIDGITLTTTDVTVTSSGTYGISVPHTFSLTIPFSANAGALSRTISVTVITN